MRKRPIGVFDSGVGGLSVLKELHKLLPGENFVFLADQLHVPYGEKTQKELISLNKRITNFFIKNYDIKLMVIACNTATCYTIDALRAKYSLPIVGTVPAVKPAGENTKSKIIAVIATPATSKSQALKKLIKDHCKGIKVFNIPCWDLENAVEEGDLGNKRISFLLHKYLEKIKDIKVDYMVLGCTHYPFLKSNIQEIMNSQVTLLDSGLAIAKRTRSLLLRDKMKNKNSKNKGKTIYLTTGDRNRFSRVASQLLGKKIMSEKVKI